MAENESDWEERVPQYRRGWREKRMAEDAVASVRGVWGVHNHLAIPRDEEEMNQLTPSQFRGTLSFPA